MDRLKPMAGLTAEDDKTYLHSNMDRLKHSAREQTPHAEAIYIPIWID